MTKDKALYTWFNAFMKSYPVTSVPDDAVFPWLTYEFPVAAFGDGQAASVVNIWMWTESEAAANKKADDFREYVLEHDMIRCDDGYIWVTPGNPWCLSLTDDANKTIKRRYININFEYLINKR